MRFDRMAVSMMLAYLFGTGPATVVPGGLHAFVKTRPELAVPDIEFMFRGTSHHPHLWFPLVYPAFTRRLRHPADAAASRQPRRAAAALGRSARARRASATTSSPRRTICRRCAQGFKLARELAYPAARSIPIAATELNPGDKVQTDAEIDAWLRNTRDHRAPSGRHLPDGHDARRGARSRDARARRRSGCAWSMRRRCPISSRAHINACVIMMAEKASDMIRRRTPLPAAMDA